MNWMYEKLRPHIGHNIVCVSYGRDGEEPFDICIECEDCNEVLVSAESFDEDEQKESVNMKLNIEIEIPDDIEPCTYGEDYMAEPLIDDETAEKDGVDIEMCCFACDVSIVS